MLLVLYGFVLNALVPLYSSNLLNLMAQRIIITIHLSYYQWNTDFNSISLIVNHEEEGEDEDEEAY